MRTKMDEMRYTSHMMHNFVLDIQVAIFQLPDVQYVTIECLHVLDMESTTPSITMLPVSYSCPPARRKN